VAETRAAQERNRPVVNARMRRWRNAESRVGRRIEVVGGLERAGRREEPLATGIP
jgi:hypothetical protein